MCLCLYFKNFLHYDLNGWKLQAILHFIQLLTKPYSGKPCSCSLFPLRLSKTTKISEALWNPLINYACIWKKKRTVFICSSSRWIRRLDEDRVSGRKILQIFWPFNFNLQASHTYGMCTFEGEMFWTYTISYTNSNFSIQTQVLLFLEDNRCLPCRLNSRIGEIEE